MRQGFLQSSRYSPGNMDRESLEAVFVGRDAVMEDVLSRVAKSIRGPQKHYILLVGPSGSGKTHILVLAYHRLLASLNADDAGDSVAIALLKEEEWGVTSYLDLVVRILRALAEEAPQLNAGIAEVCDRFPKDPLEAETLAVTLLRRHCEGKTLLLLCENLVDLFQGLNNEGQKRWRAAIQEDGNWAIVATTPQLFAGVTLQDNPFYGFFTIRALDKIDLDTGIELLVKKAIHEDKADLADFLRAPLGRARARAVHHLATGNHRAYVVLSDFLEKESLEDLVGPLMRMVDHLTPHYQGKMRQLPPAPAENHRLPVPQGDASDRQGHINFLPDDPADGRQADRGTGEGGIGQPQPVRAQHFLRALGAPDADLYRSKGQQGPAFPPVRGVPSPLVHIP